MKLKNRIIAITLSSALLMPNVNIAFAVKDVVSPKLSSSLFDEVDMVSEVCECYDQKDMTALAPYHREFVDKFIKYIEDGTDFSENPLTKSFVCDEDLRMKQHSRLIEYIKKSPDKKWIEELYAELSWISYVINLKAGYSVRGYNYGLEWIVGVFGCFDSSKKREERERYREILCEYYKFINFSRSLLDFYSYKDGIGAASFCYCIDTIMYLAGEIHSSKSLSELNTQLRTLEGLKSRIAKLMLSSDSIMKVMARGLHELLFEHVDRIIQAKKLELGESKEVEKPKSFDKSQERYIALDCELGSGGNGSVGIYMDTKIGNKVAVKTLFRKDFDEKVVQRMQRVDSPYVAKALDLIDLGDGKKGLVMECVHGAQYLDYGVQRFTDKKQLLGICLQLTEAFKAFETAGLCVTDFTHYGNILLDDEGNVKFIDYDGVGNCWDVYNLEKSLQEIGTILAATDQGLLNDFAKRLGIAFEVFRGEQRPIDVQVKASYDVLKSLKFDYIIKTLQDMKKDD